MLYVLIVFAFSSKEFVDDESTYVMYSNNILNGYYSPSYPNINLWVGPGYPLFISFCTLLGFSLTAIKYLNALLMFFALLFFYKKFDYIYYE